jgi:hypothetical protein
MPQPAARQGDPVVGTDTHILLVPSPGGPVPTPTPLPFNGKLTTACSTNVFINSMGAATVNSVAPRRRRAGPTRRRMSVRGGSGRGRPQAAQSERIR